MNTNVHECQLGALRQKSFEGVNGVRRYSTGSVSDLSLGQ